ncbi:hypothetical protein B0H34DRAFT_725694, partial [Crassisporium funariophilum]
MWLRFVVPQDGELRFEAGLGGEGGGFRVYVCVRGGLPGFRVYLGSKSTYMGLGGYQHSGTCRSYSTHWRISSFQQQTRNPS